MLTTELTIRLDGMVLEGTGEDKTVCGEYAVRRMKIKEKYQKTALFSSFLVLGAEGGI